ncbi:hypothetical protein MHYP_G00275500 [Metynnis hypsauchen]
MKNTLRWTTAPPCVRRKPLPLPCPGLKNGFLASSVISFKSSVWNSEMRACFLDFHGRVKQTLAKNFQLVCPENPEKVMQFGRTDEEHFALDYSAPLCAPQAFAIALSWFEEWLFSLKRDQLQILSVELGDESLCSGLSWARQTDFGQELSARLSRKSGEIGDAVRSCG